MSEDYSIFGVCEECHHSMNLHIGMVDMGGGHSEVMGCAHMSNDGICECMEVDDFE